MVVVDAKRLVGGAGVVVAVAVVVALVGSIGPCRRGGSRAAGRSGVAAIGVVVAVVAVAAMVVAAFGLSGTS